MADDAFGRRDDAGVERPPEVETHIGDQRPRERRLNKLTLQFVATGSLLGAVVFIVLAWVIGQVSGTGGGLKFYLFAVVLGLAVGAVLLPYLALERADGHDARVVARRTRRGRADAPIEGAQRADRERAVTRAKTVRRDRSDHHQKS